jgi:hypothetical protein
LQAALHCGHIDIVQLLLKGADENVQGGRCNNALKAASFKGHAEIVKLLVERGANVNGQGGPYTSALSAAAEGGHGFSLGWRWLGLVSGSEISMLESDDLVIVVLLDSANSLGRLRGVSNSVGCMVFSVSESLEA